MKLVPYIFPTELSKVKKFSSRLPADFAPMVKLATTRKTTIWEARNIENQIREKGLEKVEAGEKKRLEGCSRSEKK